MIKNGSRVVRRDSKGAGGEKFVKLFMPTSRGREYLAELERGTSEQFCLVTRDRIPHSPPVGESSIFGIMY